MKTGYILGLSIGHNGGACLLKDGEIVFSIEEERLTRIKADGAPLASMVKVLEYTDKVDAIVVAYPAPDRPKLEYSQESIYLGMARKIGLIDTLDRNYMGIDHPQFFDLTSKHHLMHAACAFYRSGFDDAAIVVVDGAGSEIKIPTDKGVESAFEIESIYNYTENSFIALYKKYGTDSLEVIPHKHIYENGYEIIVDFTSGIGKAYDAVTDLLGFSILECGKTMGLAAYGKPNDNIPNFFDNYSGWSSVNPSLVPPSYRKGSVINFHKYDVLKNHPKEDIAYKIQTETQEEVLKLIIKASEMSGKNNICLTGGYALNCSANYWYLDKLNELGITLYVEPNSSDAGTAVGAALYHYNLDK